jgi:DNA-directed RNA polymerase II subunit RPB2
MEGREKIGKPTDDDDNEGESDPKTQGTYLEWETKQWGRVGEVS